VIKAVIFDMDGLMLDSERIAKICWQAAGEKLGCKVDDKLFMSVVGVSEKNSEKIVTEHFGAGFDYKAFRETIEAIKKEYVRQNGIPIKKGLKELLEYLNAKNIKTAVATSTSYCQAIEMIKNAGIFESFDHIICGDMVSKSKPEPDIYLTAMRQLDVSPDQSMVLEDSFAGITAAHAAGAYTVMIPDLIEPDEYILSLANAMCGSLLDVIDILEKGDFGKQA